MTRASVLALIALLPAGAVAQDGSIASRQSPEIIAAGTGVVRLKPDLATVTIAVVTRGPTAAAAGTANVERILPVLAALKRQRLPDSAIVTTGYTVGQERVVYERSQDQAPPNPVYVARNAVRVSISNLAELGTVLDTSLLAGATEITGISFGSSLATVARHRAVAEAVTAARADAASGAEAAGGRLGPIIEMNFVPGYSSVAGGMSEFSGMGSMAASTPLMPNDVLVTVRVVVRFVYIARR